jgi:ubiquinone/menaquinone biosynthesis C-methylase UbiE
MSMVTTASTSVEPWLSELVSTDGFSFISDQRAFSHDEAQYDAQYANDPANFRVGRGMLRVLREHDADLTGPAIEIGCGTGLLTLGLASELPHPLLLATDPSPAFLRLTRRKLEQAGVNDPRVRYGVLMGEEIDRIPAGEWSLIALRSTLHHVLDWERFLAHTARALRPTGVLVMQEPCMEGYLLMGLLARLFPMASAAAGTVLSPEHRRHAQVFEDTMRFYCRRDLDKTKAEDKHLFRVDEIMQVAQAHGLDVRFHANRTFESYDPVKPGDGEPDHFRGFLRLYMRYCMSWPEPLLKIFDQVMTPHVRWIEESTAGGTGPHLHGVFVAKKR